MPDTIDETEAPRRLRALRIDRVVDRTDLKQSTIYGLVAQDKFPKPFKLGGDGPTVAAAWLEHEIDAWLLERANERFLTTPIARMAASDAETAKSAKSDLPEAA